MATFDSGPAPPAGGGRVARPGGVLMLLFVANVVNFFDRAVPAIVAEPIRLAFGLDDFQLGLIAAAFTVGYAIAAAPLGVLADRTPRQRVMAIGLAGWSLATGLCGVAGQFGAFLGLRMAVGVGEASYGPAALSLLADLYPPDRRSRATGLYMLGLPVGLMLAYFTVGSIAHALGGWRAPFLVAALPGLALSACLWLIRAPARTASAPGGAPFVRSLGRVLRIRTLWWITLSGVGANFAAYAANSFLVPLLQRYYRLPLGHAAIAAGVIIGVTGVAGLLAGGWAADRAHSAWPRGRLLFGAASMAIAASTTFAALSLGQDGLAGFIVLFAAGWTMQYQYYTCVYPAIQDVVAPSVRATAVALYFVCLYVLGGAFGPALLGSLSDHDAQAAMHAAGAVAMTAQFRAQGLHSAMVVIPAAFLLTAVALLLASRSFSADLRVAAAESIG